MEPFATPDAPNSPETPGTAAPIGIIGIGKLGLCLALNLEAVGYPVVGLDRDPRYIQSLQTRTLKSHEPQVEQMLAAAQNFTPTADPDTFWAVRPPIVFIVVATPTPTAPSGSTPDVSTPDGSTPDRSTPDGGYDHTQVDAVLADIAARDLPPTHLVVMCTTMPGYCDTAAPQVEARGHTLSYNPEFIAQGRIVHDQQYPDQILIGEGTPAAGTAIESIYRRLCPGLHSRHVDAQAEASHNNANPHASNATATRATSPSIHRMTRLSAEITKLATNCFITTKISFANSIGALAETVGAEPDKILAAIGADSRIGTKYLGYGFGYGGPCFPRDNRALAKFGRDNGFALLLSQATDEVNRRHLDFQTAQWLARHAPHETITFTQVTYKPGTTILEESQQLALALRLAQAGRKVRIREHPDVIAQLRTDHGNLFEYETR